MKAIEYLKRRNPLDEKRVSDLIERVEKHLEDHPDGGVDIPYTNDFNKTNVKFISNYYRKLGWSVKSTFKYPAIRTDPIIRITVPTITRLLHWMKLI